MKRPQHKTILSTIGILFLLSSFQVSLCAGGANEQKWGTLKEYDQNLPRIEHDAHFNNTSKYPINFAGSRTTFNATIEDYSGPFANPCELTKRTVDQDYKLLDLGFKLPSNRVYMAMHHSGDKLVVLAEDFKVYIFLTQVIPYIGLVMHPFRIIEIPLEQRGQLIPNEKALIMSSEGEQYFHIVFPSAMYTLEIPRDSTEENLSVPIYQNAFYQSRKNITELIFVKGLLFVAAGTEGIDVYKIGNSTKGNYSLVLKIDQQFLDLSNNMNVQDMAVDLLSNLYIADFNNGVIILQIQEYDLTKSVKLHQFHDLVGSERIAVRGDHTFVVTGQIIGSPNNGYFVKEVFFSIQDRNYFVNRNFEDSYETWVDIKMGDLFTYIQGNGHHRILYQGINRKLFPQEDKHSDYRSGIAIHEKNFFDVKQIQNVELGETSFIGLANNFIYSIELSEIPPMLICRPGDKRQIGTHEMRVKLYSTDCAKANSHDMVLQDLWQVCRTEFDFTYNVHDIWVDGQNVSIIGFVVAIIVLSTIVLILAIFFLLSLYEQKFLKVDQALTEYKQKYVALESQQSSSNPYKDQSIMADKSGMYFNQEVQIDVNALK